MKRPVYPVPEAIDGRRWTIDGDGAHVDLAAAKMAVPLADTPAARGTRAHELAHAKITPRVSAGATARQAGVSLEALQSVEDCRVHFFLASRGIARANVFTEPELAALAERLAGAPDRLVAACIVAAANTEEQAAIVEAFRAVPQIAPRLDWIVPHVERIAEAVASGIGPRRGRRRPRVNPAMTKAGFRSRTIPAARLFDSLFPADGGGEVPADPSVEAGAARLRRKANIASCNGGEWGHLESVTRAGMSAGRRLPPFRARRCRPDGGAPTRFDRLPVDAHIFTRAAKRAGGTVLIDTSGSMGLTAEQVARIVAAAPAATVAIYCGEERLPRDSGRLAIVAERGRRSTAGEIADTGIPGGCNVVDGPALQWLARQPAPRVWVSDGQVNGVGAVTCQTLYADALRIVRRASIVRVDCPEDGAALLRSIHRRGR